MKEEIPPSKALSPSSPSSSHFANTRFVYCSAGLEHARLFLEPIKEEFPWITYSDLWTLAGCVAIEEMGGPKIKWKPGRTDFVDDSKVSLSLPSPREAMNFLLNSSE